MSDTTKKLVLAFPPFSTPLSPPLGVCMLKSCVDRMASGWSSRVLDLNLLYHEKLFEAIDEDSSPFLRGNPLPEIAVSRGAETFLRGGNDSAFYQRPDRYAAYADPMLRFFGANASQLSKRLEGAYRNAEAMPAALETLADTVLAEEPDAVGISVCYNEQFWFGICLAKLIKERASLPVIFGGTCFLHDAEKLLVDFEDVMDFIVTGEGETALARLLADLESPGDIPGLCWRSGRVARSHPPAFERKLDVLGHPDFSDLDLRRYYTPSPVLPVLTSRGCYWRRCAFCTHYKSSGMTYRLHSMPHVIEEFRQHVSEGIDHFNVTDEMLSPKRFLQLADAILNSRLDIHYYAMAKPTIEFDEKRLQRIHDSGCRYIMWGVESGNQRVLDLMEKGTALPDVQEVLHRSAKVGLFNHVFVFFGFPTETREEAQDTILFLDENKDVIHKVLRGTFQLDRGSPISDHPDKFSIKKMWPAGGYPRQNIYDFECSIGMRRKEVDEFLDAVLPFLRAFSLLPDTMGKYREHALLLYSQRGAKRDLKERRFPPPPTGSAQPGEKAVILPEASEPSERIDYGRGDVARKWWLVGLASLLVVPVLVFFVRRAIEARKVRQNRSRYPDYEVKEFRGFLSDQECEYLIQAAQPFIRRRGAGKKGSGRWTAQVEKSSTAFLERDETILEIKKRIAALTGTALERQEKIQVTHYDPLEYYGPHFDATGDAPGVKGRTGDRYCTVIVYLNDDFEGGATFFPEIGRRIVPERGKAVFFRNLSKDGDDQHPMARHVGEVVLSGEKWVCNQWIRQHSFVKPSKSKAPGFRGKSRKRTRRRPR